MSQYVMGLDNGGTVSKAALFDLEGHELAVASRHTPVDTPKPGYTQRDMEQLWQANCACVREVLEKSKVDPKDVLGLAVCGHGKGLYPWGRDGRPAGPGIVSTDNRAWQYPQKWEESGVFQELYPRLCQKQLACQQASILAWMKDNQPSVYDQIQWVFSVKDYIRFRLTGQAHSEVTDLSGSGLMDVKNARVERDILEKLGIGECYEKIPPLCHSYEKCGEVTEEAARLTGLLPGTPVAGGMFDIDACAIAMDITRPESLCTITGTWSINEFISPQPILGTEIAMNSLYAIPGYYLLEECSATSAGNMEWAISQLWMGEGQQRPDNAYAVVEQAARTIAPEECEVYYLPFLYGSNVHPLAKATFVGLTSYHTKAHMLRAVYEGVAFSHKTHIQRLLSARKPPQAIRMAGGAVNSQFWVHLFADVLGYPIETVSGVKELGALGCAMAASVAAGVYRDYQEAASKMVRVNAPVLPDMEKNAIYERKFKTYTALTQALDTVWDRFQV